MEENSPPNVRTLGGREYTLRQTRPDQVTTHWDTCYTLHSACMERKVEQDAQQIQALEERLRMATQALEYLSKHGPAAYTAIARQALHAMVEGKG